MGPRGLGWKEPLGGQRWLSGMHGPNPASQPFADGLHHFVWLLNLSREAQGAKSSRNQGSSERWRESHQIFVV